MGASPFTLACFLILICLPFFVPAPKQFPRSSIGQRRRQMICRFQMTPPPSPSSPPFFLCDAPRRHSSWPQAGRTVSCVPGPLRPHNECMYRYYSLAAAANKIRGGPGLPRRCQLCHS